MEKKLGVYIHIPFCASKCGYCDFYSCAGCNKLMPKYHNAVIRHIRDSAHILQQYYTDTVYFGGGTPSYYGARRICEIFNELKAAGLVYRDAEVTMEANPDSVKRRDLDLLLANGVNRISLGVQSANDDILKLIGRRHNWVQVEKAVKNARAAGFKNISIDLIYGLPTQTKKDWADTLDKALGLKPDHISCYALTLEEGTPLYSYKDSPVLPSDDEQADMYLYAAELLPRYGYRQYEVSNFAKPGFESRHNMKYWRLKDYIGFGPGAHSCVGGLRYSFIRDLKGYIAGMQNEQNIIDEYEHISINERATEYIMLGMRTARGISEKEYRNTFRADFAPLEELLREFDYRGWAKKSEKGRWHFTPNGFLISNTLIGMLLEKQTEEKLSAQPWMELDDEPRFVMPLGDEVFYRQPEPEEEDDNTAEDMSVDDILDELTEN